MDDSYEDVIEINKDQFTDQERQLILQVVARDEDVLRQERSRIELLQDELEELRERGVPEDDEETCGRVCRRCRSPLGILFNSGALCQSCSKIVCKECRVTSDHDEHVWICTFCGKVREIRAESGAWFYQDSNEISDEKPTKKKKKMYGSFLMKRVFSKVKRSDTKIYKDPDWSEIIHKVKLEKDDFIKEDKEPIRGAADGIVIHPAPTRHNVNDDIDRIVAEYNEHADIGDADSIGSNYSEDEEDFTESVQIAGEILLGFRYDHGSKQFEVQVHKAKDLIIADSLENSTDPYVKAYLLPDTKRSAKRKTKIKKKTLNPDFDEILSFKLEYDQLLSRTIAVSVWHSNFAHKNKCLGETFIKVEDYLNSSFTFDDPLPQWYTLKGRVINRDQIKFCGDLVANICYKAPGFTESTGKNPVKGTLEVHVIRAQNLKALSEGGFSNPFCKITLISKNSKVDKFKTHHIMGTVDPYWNKNYTFNNIAIIDLQDSVLQFSIWDYQKGSSHVLLGAARLGLGRHEGRIHDSFGEEVEIWQKILDQPNEQTEYTIPLRSALDSVKEDVFVPPGPVKHLTMQQFDEEKKKFGSLSNLSSKKFLQADTISMTSTGSMLSLYSMAGGEHGDLAITGELLFSVKYDDVSGIFSINIEKAKGLAAVDTKKMTSDPYVKVYLLPDEKKTSKKKTLHRRKTINPIWNETIKYKLPKKDLLQKTLQLTVWNHDRLGKNDCLGEVQLDMKQYASTNKLNVEQSVWYTLQVPAPVVGGGADENIGEIVVGLKYDNRQLAVSVKEAHALTTIVPDEMPTPFVKCYFLPDKSRKSKRKTGVQKKTVNPTWNEIFSYKNVDVEELQHRVIEITVWDHNKSAHQFLGGIRLGLGQGEESWNDSFKEEVSIWESMIAHLGILAEYTIPLRKSMTSIKSKLPVDIPMITGGNGFAGIDTMSSVTGKQSFVHEENIAEGTPAIRLSLQYSDGDDHLIENKKKGPNKGFLKVILKEAKCLPLKPDGDVPSVYCRLFLHPKKKGEKFVTETYYKSLEPHWEANIMFEGVTLEGLKTCCLEINLFDETVNSNKSDKGRQFASLRLGSGGLLEKWDDAQGSEVDFWFMMLNNPEVWNTKLVPLRVHEYPEEKAKKSSSKSSMKASASQSEIDDDCESQMTDDGQPAEAFDMSGRESPRTSALRAMGGDAAQEVIDIMTQQNQPEYVPYSADGLHTISEENEMESASSVSQPTLPPIITVTSDSRRGHFDDDDDDEPEFDYPIPEKKKVPPQMSLLKRSTSQSSLASVYSTDSANVYGQVPIRGEVQFGIKYDNASATFEVHVFQAREIAAVDSKKEVTDPYCKVYLLPDRTKAGKKKTRTRKKTLNPEWDEILEFKISHRELRTRTFSLTLWHQEKLGRNVFLGEVMLSLADLVDNQSLFGSPEAKWYDLCEKAPAPKGDLFKGELLLSIMFEDDSLNLNKAQPIEEKKKKKKKKKDMKSNGKILLHLKQANDLPAADRNGVSDPFCKVYLLPGKQAKTKRKTPVIKHTIDPVWDFRTEYDVDYEDLGDMGIEFTVWDWDRGKTNDLLGCSRIGLGNKTDSWDDADGIEVEVWQHLIDNPNQWKDFKIPLRSKLDSRLKRK